MRFQFSSMESLNATVNIIHLEDMSNETTEISLFISSVLLKPRSKVSHHNMSALVVATKFKFTT
jgi:hypothetical protein